ncbi:MAG TPA: zinc ribbon domain-containing protein, partial [Blastocatellia bacterium]
MQQSCKTCGYDSPETDKFCRQCGGQLTAETEFTSAATLNHGKAESNSQAPSVGTGRLSPNIADVISADTERYYTPPQYAQAHAPAPAPAPVPIPTPAPVPVQVTYERIPTYALPNLNPEPHSRFKGFSSFMKGMFIFLLFVGLLVTTGLTVFFAQEAEQARNRSNWERENGRGRRVGGDNANNRAQDALSQMEEALELAREAAEKASAAGATLTTGADKSVDLSKYAFPDAQVEAKIDT